MNACLIDYIGFRGLCPEVTPPSGIYINDFPVGQLRRLSDLTDPDRVDVESLWLAIQSRCQGIFASDVRKNLPYKFKAADILSNVITAEKVLPQDIVGENGNWVGVLVTVDGSQNMEFSMNWIRVWLQSDADIHLRITDVSSGTNLFDETFEGVAGDNQFRVSLNVPLVNGKREIFIAMDDSIQPYASFHAMQTKVPSAEWCGQHGVSRWSSLRGATVGAATTDPLKSDLTIGNYSGGLIASYSLRCSMNSFICQNLESLKMAWAYLLVMEIYRECLEADSIITRYTLVNSEEVRARIAEYQAKYQQELMGVLQQAKISDAICIECAHPVQTEYVTG